MRVVLDTNVLVSGVLPPMGPPGHLLDLVLVGALTLITEPRILSEYCEVLTRPRLRLDQEQVDRLLETLEDISLPVVGLPWPCPLPDPDDEIFLATAAAGQAVLVTGNIADYPTDKRQNVTVWTPRQCLEHLRGAGSSG